MPGALETRRRAFFVIRSVWRILFDTLGGDDSLTRTQFVGAIYAATAFSNTHDIIFPSQMRCANSVIPLICG